MMIRENAGLVPARRSRHIEPSVALRNTLDNVRRCWREVSCDPGPPRPNGSSFARPLLLLMLLLPCVVQVAWAQGVYQWRDDGGRMVYGDRPPAGAQARRVEVAPGPTPEATDAARERAEALQRLVDEMAVERRRREEAAAAAALQWIPRPPAPEPVIERPPVVRSYLWSPYWPAYRGGVHYPGYAFPGKRPRPGYHRWPPPEDMSRRPRPPEFTQPRRAPEFTNPSRAAEFMQPRVR